MGGRGSNSGAGGPASSMSGSAASVRIPSRISDISYNEAEQLFDAPIGTSFSMEVHTTGDYVGEYTRVADGWVGSQRYRSRFRKPPTVTTARGFAMQVVGNDMKRVDTPNGRG